MGVMGREKGWEGGGCDGKGEGGGRRVGVMGREKGWEGGGWA